MAMTAGEAYGRFMRELLEHFKTRANQDAALARLQLPPVPSGPCKNILAFTVPGEPEIRLAFKQSRIVSQVAGQLKPRWKVFALEIGLGNDPNRQPIETSAVDLLPIGWHGISGKIFFIELPWGQGNSQSEYDRLSNHQVRERLFDFADDAIRFALSTINERNEGRAGSRR
jgi:hypothetical protein